MISNNCNNYKILYNLNTLFINERGTFYRKQFILHFSCLHVSIDHPVLLPGTLSELGRIPRAGNVIVT